MEHIAQLFGRGLQLFVASLILTRRVMLVNHLVDHVFQLSCL